MSKLLDLSQPTHTRMGSFIEGLFPYLALVNEDGYRMRIYDAGLNRLTIDPCLVTRDELEVCVDLFCERFRREDLRSPFKEFIMKSYDRREMQIHLRDAFNNIPLDVSKPTELLQYRYRRGIFMA